MSVRHGPREERQRCWKLYDNVMVARISSRESEAAVVVAVCAWPDSCAVVLLSVTGVCGAKLVSL